MAISRNDNDMGGAKDTWGGGNGDWHTGRGPPSPRHARLWRITTWHARNEWIIMQKLFLDRHIIGRIVLGVFILQKRGWQLHDGTHDILRGRGSIDGNLKLTPLPPPLFFPCNQIVPTPACQDSPGAFVDQHSTLAALGFVAGSKTGQSPPKKGRLLAIAGVT